MRFMMMIKSDATTEAGAMPEEHDLVAMGRYNHELIKAGVLLTGEGLHPSSQGFRLHNDRGTLTVIDGPFGEPTRLIAGFWLIDVKSREEAIEWAKRVPFEPGGTGEIEVRKVMEMDDFPVQDNESGWREQEIELRGGTPDGPLTSPTTSATTPADGARKLRWLMMFKADAHSEAGALPNEQSLTDMGNLMADMASAGVLLGGEGLAPSSKGARVRFAAGKRTVLDGPFAETKELIGGFCMLQCISRDEAIAWASRGMRIHGDGESEVRRVMDTEDFPAELVAKVPEVFAAGQEFRERAAR